MLSVADDVTLQKRPKYFPDNRIFLGLHNFEFMSFLFCTILKLFPVQPTFNLTTAIFTIKILSKIAEKTV